jgi:hypothetical protein
MSWRYIAARLNGDGTETIVHPEVPLGDDTTIKLANNAPTELSGSISPEVLDLVDINGRPLIERWSTAIYAEADGEIRGGGIVVDDGVESDTLKLDCMGFAGYPNGQPYTEANSWPPNPYPVNGIEPTDLIREVWRHLQAQTRGNLNVNIDSLRTGLLVGKMVAQGEFDTENGPLSFEYTPLMLRWFETFDLGDAISNIVENTPLEFWEEHSWNDDETQVEHYIRMAYPRRGARRQDHRFVVGENIESVALEIADTEYADTVMAVGAGEGIVMPRAVVFRDEETRIRRCVYLEDKTRKTEASVAVAARTELAAHVGVDVISSVTVKPDAVSDLIGLQPGDEVRLMGDSAYRDIDMWVRIEAKTITPSKNGLSFDLTRADNLI